MKRGRKRTLTRHVLVKMADIGGDYDKSSAGPDANELKSGRMASRRMYRKAGSELGVAIVEQDAACIVEPHDSADVLDLERMRQPRISHEAPRGIRKLAFLEMESRVRKPVEISHMVVMQMREDDIFDRIHIDVERAERLHGTAQERPLPLLRYLRVETGVDDEGTPSSFRHPHEVVHRHRPVVRVAADEMVAAPCLAGGVADGEELVFLVGHAISQRTGGLSFRFDLVERLARVAKSIDP